MTDDDVASNQNISVAAGGDELITGDDDIVTVGAGATVGVHGYYDVVNGGYGALALNGIDITANVSGDQIAVHNNSIVTINGGNDTITHNSGYITINNAGEVWDTLSGTILEITLLTGSRLILSGNQFDVFMAANCTLQAESDNTNIYGSDDRIHTGGATVGGDFLAGDRDRIFVEHDSQLEVHGSNNVIHADDLSSLAMLGSNNRLLGANFAVIGEAGAEFYIGGNGARGPVDTVTATDDTIRIGYDSNITLNGDDDTVAVLGGGFLYFVGGGLNAHIGADETLTINSNGHPNEVDVLTGSDYSVTVSEPAIVDLSTLGDSVLLAADVTLNVERSHNVIQAYNSDTISILSGGANQITLGADDVISDGGSNTLLIAGTDLGSTTIENFGNDAGGVVDFFNYVGSFSTPEQAYAALTSDGAGGLELQLGINGVIDFKGTTSLSVGNFKIN